MHYFAVFLFIEMRFYSNEYEFILRKHITESMIACLLSTNIVVLREPYITQKYTTLDVVCSKFEKKRILVLFLGRLAYHQRDNSLEKQIKLHYTV